MAFTWDCYTTHADGVLNLNTEAAFRSAISRSYYAAFNQAHALLRHTHHYQPCILVDPKTGEQRAASKHEKTAHAVEAAFPVLNGLLNNGRVLRNRCDYDLLPAISRAQADKHIENMKLIIDALSKGVP